MAAFFDEVIEGVLSPDVYRLEVLSRTALDGRENAAGFGTTSFGVSFAVVPEPGTGLLLAIGLAGLAGGRSRPNQPLPPAD